VTKQKWAVDAVHSSIDFTIKHLVIAKVKGNFQSFEAMIEADPEDLTTADIEFTVDIASIDTRNADRDNHLKSADFFDIENYPKLTFKSTEIKKTDDGEYEVTGDLSLHGVTRPETFKITYEGTAKDPWGNEKVGFSGTGTINREDYGLTYNAALETGGVLIGSKVNVTIEIEAQKA
jgi:polyisoprenoid-binding protein YceI